MHQIKKKDTILPNDLTNINCYNTHRVTKTSRRALCLFAKYETRYVFGSLFAKCVIKQ